MKLGGFNNTQSLKAHIAMKDYNEQEEKQVIKTQNVDILASNFNPMIKGAHIFLHQTAHNKPKGSSHHNYSQLLNTVLDKLFDYLHLITDTDSTSFIDVKIRLIMDALHICFT